MYPRKCLIIVLSIIDKHLSIIDSNSTVNKILLRFTKKKKKKYTHTHIGNKAMVLALMKLTALWVWWVNTNKNTATMYTVHWANDLVVLPDIIFISLLVNITEA